MKIIDETPSSKVSKIQICTNCGITLEYVPADTRVEKRTDYTGDTDSYRVLTCPKCNEDMNVSMYSQDSKHSSSWRAYWLQQCLRCNRGGRADSL